MKTLAITLAVLTLSFTTLLAKDGTFTSAIIPEDGKALQLNLSSRQWIKIISFVQNDRKDTIAGLAGIAVFKGDEGLWVLFATKANETGPSRDVIIAGPATVIVSPPDNGNATMFLTYQRGSD